MFKTPQESFWAGEFGNNYIDRNNSQKILASKINLFSKAISRTEGINSVIEFGSNIGLNLVALKTLIPNLKSAAIEINQDACKSLESIEGCEVHNTSILEYQPKKQFDLSLIKTVLIHINPEFLPKVYQQLYESSKKYICIVEYYNPSPVTVNYRGHDDRLFKRDFAGEFLEKYPNVKLVDYGFIYKRDLNFPLDDVTWFLMEKPE